MSKKLLLFTIFLTLALLAPLLPSCACNPAQPATAYTALIPAVLQSGSKQPISVALFAGDAPTSGIVELTLLKDGTQVSRAQGNVQGNSLIQLDVPDLEEGEYTLQIKGDTFEDQAAVQVDNNYLVFLETDKPIYKPGQTIHMRIMTLDSGLKPVSENATVEVLDAKGIKIFRSETITDEFGMTTLDLPVSTEPNLGTWKIRASTPKTDTQVDVRIEEYVLPKYEVNVDLRKNGS